MTDFTDHAGFTDHTRIVLCRPEGSGNIGAACRAMKNMGLSKLVIVRDRAGVDPTEVRKMALHAYDVFENARFVPALEEALAQTQLAVAVTRRHGAKRNKKVLPIGEIGALVRSRSGADIAFVFGNEEHGLSNEEVELCSTKLSIPTAPEFPSLNLAQAVQIVSYELFRQGAAPHGEKMRHPGPAEADTPVERSSQVGAERAAQRERIQELTGVIMETLDALGFFKNTDGHYTRQLFRDVFHRAGLRTHEADYIQRVFRKIRFIRKEESEDRT
ncbi:MAG: RNA methyltransferase [Spirochaetota bacterium]